VTASKSNKSCSELIGIDDPEIAFAFNMECAEIFYLWEQEQEVKRLEAMMAGTLLSQLSGQPKMNGRQVREITPADIRDQGW